MVKIGAELPKLSPKINQGIRFWTALYIVPYISPYFWLSPVKCRIPRIHEIHCIYIKFMLKLKSKSILNLEIQL